MTTDIGRQKRRSPAIFSLIESLSPIQKMSESRQSTYSWFRSQPRDTAQRTAAARLWAGSVTPPVLEQCVHAADRALSVAACGRALAPALRAARRRAAEPCDE